MKHILLFLFLFKSFLFFEINPLKRAFKFAYKGKCEKAEKFFHKVSSSQKDEFPLTFLLQRAIYYENCQNELDSSCFYYSLALNRTKEIFDDDQKFLNGYNIDQAWIKNKIKTKGCDLSVQKFLRICGADMKYSDSLEVYLNSAYENRDSLVAPACYCLCQGIYSELILKDRKKACEYYKIFANINARTYYDIHILESESKLLNKNYLYKRLDCCKYYCQIVIDDSSGCADQKYSFENLNLSLQNNEDSIFPISFLYAEARFERFCKNNLDRACVKYIKLFQSIYENIFDSIYESAYKYKILHEINEFVYQGSCRAVLLKDITSPLEKLSNQIVDLADTVKKNCTLNTNKKKIRPNFEAEIMDSVSLKLRFYFNADVWAFYDSIGLGEYKTPIIDSLLVKTGNALNDFFWGFDTIKLETYILGLADGTPIDTLKYKGEYGNINTSFFYANLDSINKLNGSWYFDLSKSESRELLGDHSINDVDLAILRAYTVETTLNKLIKIKNGSKQSKIFIYDYPDILENEKPEYRRLEIVLIMRNVLNQMKKDYEFKEAALENWSYQESQTNKKMKEMLEEVRRKK